MMRKPSATAVANAAPARRRLLLSGFALAAGVLLTRRAAGAPPRPIEMGVIPYMPTARLFAAHEPLRLHFEKTFGRPVAMSTAPDFHAFQRRVLDNEFDFTVIGPGPAWQAHLDRGHAILATSAAPLRIFILVRRDSPLRDVAELRGKAVAVIDPLTVTAQTTMAMLRERGIEPGRDIRVRHDRTPFNSIQAVLFGEVAAAGFPDIAYGSLPAETREQLRVLHTSDPMPAMLFIARPAPDAPSPEEFQAALLDFAQTGSGLTFVKELGHGGLVKPDFKALRVLERFVPETRRLMAAP